MTFCRGGFNFNDRLIVNCLLLQLRIFSVFNIKIREVPNILAKAERYCVEFLRVELIYGTALTV